MGAATQCRGDGGGAVHRRTARRGGQAEEPRTDHRRQQRREGGVMTILAKKRYIGALALAVASVTALAACSSSSSASATPGATKVPGGIGEIPAAGTPSGQAATFTSAEAPGSGPNWILPIPTSATNSVSNVFTFEWMMWRPGFLTINRLRTEGK